MRRVTRGDSIVIDARNRTVTGVTSIPSIRAPGHVPGASHPVRETWTPPAIPSHDEIRRTFADIGVVRRRLDHLLLRYPG